VQRDAYASRAWRRLRVAVLLRDGWRCHWCGGHAHVADHVVPLVDGGEPMDPANLVAACVRCNSERAAATTRRRRRERMVGADVERGAGNPVLYGVSRSVGDPNRSPGTHRPRADPAPVTPGRVVTGAIRSDAVEA
jgi:hypothetical protein